MARFITDVTARDTYFETTLAGSADPAGDLRTEIQTRLAAVMSGGTNAWEAYDTGVNGPQLPGGSVAFDANVYRSLGNRGLASGAGDAASS